MDNLAIGALTVLLWLIGIPTAITIDEVDRAKIVAQQNELLSWHQDFKFNTILSCDTDTDCMEKNGGNGELE